MGSMSTASDLELLRQYGESRDDAAFRTLVERHVNLVWGTARRILGDPDLARDVVQTVFADLARKSRSLGRDTVLPAWLHRAACLAARQLLRTNSRRTAREHAAMELSDPDPAVDSQAVEALQPLLDEALSALPEGDRQAVLLRYFSGQAFAEIGARLGVSDDTAQKRVSRALDKLRELLKHRGVTVSGGTLAAAVSVAGAETAPAGLVAAVVSGVATLAPAAPWYASLGLLKPAATVLVAGALGVAALLQSRRLEALQAEHQALLRQVEARSIPAGMIPGPGGENPAQLEELLRLRAAVAQRARESGSTGPGPAAGIPSELAQAKATLAALQAEEYAKARLANRVNAGKNLGLAARIHATDHGGAFPDTLEALRQALGLNADQEFPGGIALTHFEFFPQPRKISESEPQFILFRERQAEAKPEGGTARVYVLADGTVQVLSENRVEEFERDGTAR